MQKQFEKNVWEKSNDAYSLSIRVQTTGKKHISICFLPQYRELKKALRDTLTRAEWFGLLFTMHGKLANQWSRP